MLATETFMAMTLKRKEAVRKAVKRLTRRRIEKALASLNCVV